MRFSITLATFGVLVSISLTETAFAQKHTASGATTLGERTIPAPAGLSPQMLEVVKERHFPPIIPAPKTTEEWLKLQKLLDASGEELGRKGAKNPWAPARRRRPPNDGRSHGPPIGAAGRSSRN